MRYFYILHCVTIYWQLDKLLGPTERIGLLPCYFRHRELMVMK